MKVSDLKTVLHQFSDNDEIVVAVMANDNTIPVITGDIGFDIGEYGELILKTAIYSSDIDY
jgi:hypothetical protein